FTDPYDIQLVFGELDRRANGVNGYTSIYIEIDVRGAADRKSIRAVVRRKVGNIRRSFHGISCSCKEARNVVVEGKREGNAGEDEYRKECPGKGQLEALQRVFHSLTRSVAP